MTETVTAAHLALANALADAAYTLSLHDALPIYRKSVV